MEKDEIKFYNKEFPNSFNDFIYLSREFTREEIIRCDKEGLALLCVELKRKELQYSTERNLAVNLLEEAFLFIQSGAITHSMNERVELEDKIKEYFNIK